MSNEDFINKLRCLRMHLSPLLTAEKLEILEEAERRLNGDVSTTPESFKKKRRDSTGTGTTKKQIFNQYYFK